MSKFGSWNRGSYEQSYGGKGGSDGGKGSGKGGKGVGEYLPYPPLCGFWVICLFFEHIWRVEFYNLHSLQLRKAAPQSLDPEHQAYTGSRGKQRQHSS